MIEDDRLIIIAGSETTASTFANAFYFLCRHPEKYQRLQQELDEVLPEGRENWSFDKVKNVPFLEAVINETLKLKPAISSGVPRVTPSEGLQIDEVFIPGDKIVITPTYLMQRAARYFKDPEAFLPERWLDEKSEMIKEKCVFVPFSMGKLHLNQMRM